MRRSDTIGQIADALAKAQGGIKNAAKEANNPHFGKAYADLASVRDACYVQLAQHGIAVVQSPEADGARVTVTTLLAHGSGEWIEGVLALQARDATPQAVGSAITYGRRYGLASLVGVAPDDDDGEGAQPGRDSGGAKRKPQPRQTDERQDEPPRREATAPSEPDVISTEQRKRLNAVRKEHGWSDADLKALLQRHGYASGKDIRPADYAGILEALQTGALPEREPGSDDEPLPTGQQGQFDLPAPWEREGSAH